MAIDNTNLDEEDLDEPAPAAQAEPEAVWDWDKGSWSDEIEEPAAPTEPDPNELMDIPWEKDAETQAALAAPAAAAAPAARQVIPEPTPEQLKTFEPAIPSSFLENKVPATYVNRMREIESNERKAKEIISRGVANILSTVPKKFQQREIARLSAQADITMGLLTTEKENVGGEAYSELPKDAQYLADNIRKNTGLDGVNAAQMASRHYQVKKAADSMLAGYVEDPEAYQLLKTKLYGRAETQDSQRVDGLIKVNDFGALDTVDEDVFTQLHKTLEARKAYALSITGQNRQAGSGTSGSGGSAGVPDEAKAVKAAISTIESRIQFLTDKDGKVKPADEATHAELQDRLGYLHQKNTESTNRAFDSVMSQEAESLRAMGINPELGLDDSAALSDYQSYKSNRATEAEDADIQAKRANLEDLVSKATKGLSADDARAPRNATIEQFAKANDIPIRKAKDGSNESWGKFIADLQGMGDKPAIVVVEGRVGASLGLNSGLMTRDSVNDWIEKTYDPTQVANLEKVIGFKEKNRGRILQDVRRKIPGFRVDNKGYLIDGDGDSMEENDFLVRNYNATVRASIAHQDRLEKMKILGNLRKGE